MPVKRKHNCTTKCLGLKREYRLEACMPTSCIKYRNWLFSLENATPTPQQSSSEQRGREEQKMERKAGIVVMGK